MDVASLSLRIATAATESDEGASLLTWLCPALLELGIPVWQFGVSMPALDALTNRFSMVWCADTGFTMHRTAHGDAFDQTFQGSPIEELIKQNRASGGWRLEAETFEGAHAVLREFKREGATDYVLHLVRFAPGTVLRGVALSFATKQGGGFDERALGLIAALVPILGLVTAKLALAHTLRRALGTYLGVHTSSQVLEGRIVRGGGEAIWAAILLVDLRGFTTLTDRSDPADVVTWLDEHLEVLGEPVLEQGGEILKFLGDGFLAVFPVAAPDASPCLDCERALGVALAARTANRALNRTRESRGLPTLDVDIVLHFGEVIYGNVGTRQRLDFTVIGRAVNEASRLEKGCGDLGCSILLSDSFAARCEHPKVPAGIVPLRGLDRPERVWTVPDDA